jgi:hypothetical protein
MNLIKLLLLVLLFVSIEGYCRNSTEVLNCTENLVDLSELLG